MPPSQLKRLKASLREQGITGPQKSKKEKKQGRGHNADQRVQRAAALQNIRDSFNPFEIKAPSRPSKFESTTRDSMRGKSSKPAAGRPGVTKSLGEEARRATLLPELQRRNKTGGIIDRRIGENDPTMTPEERALQRFTREKQRSKTGSLFDLEDADDEEVALTHMGRPMDFTGAPAAKDDFEENSLSEHSDDEPRTLKRRRSSAQDSDDEGDVDYDLDAPEGGDDDQPARKKTKAEVMKEVMAKSKLYKYERQKAKEDDDDLREELDKGMAEMLALLNGHKPPPKQKEAEAAGGEAAMNPDRLALLNGKAREEADREYDQRLRQLALDKRAAPTDRTKTAEEIAAEEAQRLKELEDKRRRRMQGEEVSDDEDEPAPQKTAPVDATGDDEDMQDDAAEFGLPGTVSMTKPEQLVLDDEDEFIVDDDLVASDSDADISDMSEGDESEGEEGPEDRRDEEEEDEFVRGILGSTKEKAEAKSKPVQAPATLAYTYECPRTHADFLQTISNVTPAEVPTIVQRIRALYHPSLSADNKEKLSDFSVALVDHISYMSKEKQPLRVIETLIRHIHSLSRTYPERIATAFRAHLSAFHQRGQPSAGDLTILMAISSIYPTSDHFHQVVTPAITEMAKWLEMNSPTSATTMVTGAFIVSLCIQYQKLSKRYIPEAVRFTTKALQQSQSEISQIGPHVNNLLAMAELWREKSSFCEIFTPAAFTALKNLKGQKKATQHLKILIQQARLHRRPLELHHHRPLPIRTSVPKFEESFNPDKHYDPDRERADASKLRAEYKRERKGAMRELRKDANFISREQLREKKEKDAEYERKYRKLVAEIQGEEGHEAKVYEREKRMRQGKR
ncbi:hypothetical protein AAFC00_001800 [Neodothiora populina]|uniref:Nop14-like protein n=1 Tax=Neodothiora populina TaxID=2781224 RepID=A0ABR3PR56_9PEZI